MVLQLSFAVDLTAPASSLPCLRQWKKRNKRPVRRIAFRLPAFAERACEGTGDCRHTTTESVKRSASEWRFGVRVLAEAVATAGRAVENLPCSVGRIDDRDRSDLTPVMSASRKMTATRQ